MRSTPLARDFLGAAWELRTAMFPEPGEQGAVRRLLGFDGHPAVARFAHGTAWLDDRWGDPEGCALAPVIRHLGYQAGDHAERAQLLRQLAR